MRSAVSRHALDRRLGRGPMLSEMAFSDHTRAAASPSGAYAVIIGASVV
jgi:hypothetical protein